MSSASKYSLSFVFIRVYNLVDRKLTQEHHLRGCQMSDVAWRRFFVDVDDHAASGDGRSARCQAPHAPRGRQWPTPPSSFSSSWLSCSVVLAFCSLVEVVPCRNASHAVGTLGQGDMTRPAVQWRAWPMST
uniref:Uncharacterized protein n=1 Tax=Oryza punctata TaxID=4537 RepID=A0A0E0KT70_ORYPU